MFGTRRSSGHHTYIAGRGRGKGVGVGWDVVGRAHRTYPAWSPGFYSQHWNKPGVVAQACDDSAGEIRLLAWDHTAGEEQGEEPEGSALSPLASPTHHVVHTSSSWAG